MDDAFEPTPKARNGGFLRDVLSGLSKPQKTLPSQYFYDTIGSELFEQITRLPEYYPTRTEISILTDHASEISQALGLDVLLVEYGAGASTKTRILLDSLDRPAGYVPIDVSEDFLLQTADRLRSEYAALTIAPIVGDFMIDFGLPDDLDGRPVGFFPGSTIGNLSDPEILQFMRSARKLLGPDSQFLIGLDLRKSPEILIPAYDDAKGVTAAFNLNLLARINRELAADFDLNWFEHLAIWNDDASQIEMHLRSETAQTVTIDGATIRFEAGETVHTENSRKFDLNLFRALVSPTGWSQETVWVDDQEYFAVALLRASQ